MRKNLCFKSKEISIKCGLKQVDLYEWLLSVINYDIWTLVLEVENNRRNSRVKILVLKGGPQAQSCKAMTRCSWSPRAMVFLTTQQSMAVEEQNFGVGNKWMAVKWIAL